MSGDVTIVLPTHARAAALRQTLPGILAVAGVREIVVVDDGSPDDTLELLAAVREPRLRVVRHPRRRGAPAARNTGTQAATSPWILFAEDDCRFPPDFAAVLREEADAHRADVVGAPMVNVAPGERIEDAVAATRARARGAGTLDEVAGFPAAPLLTPLLPAPALVSAAVLAHLRFDERFRGTAYREETDFFLRAARRGHRCLLTPRTYFYEQGRWGGGQARGWLATELWALRNNGRFLRRHGAWLAEHGMIASPTREQLAFARRRVAALVAAR